MFGGYRSYTCLPETWEYEGSTLPIDLSGIGMTGCM